MKFANLNKHLNIEAMGGSVRKISPMELSTSLMKGLVFEEDVDDSILTKGVIAETFSYSNESFPVSGTQFKEGLTKSLSFLEAKKEECLSELKECCSQVGEDPNCHISSFRLRGIGAFVDYIPKIYGDEDVKTEHTEIDRIKRWKYNRHVERYIDICIDIAYAQTLIATIKNENTYYLKLNQAVSVGIGQQ